MTTIAISHRGRAVGIVIVLGILALTGLTWEGHRKGAIPRAQFSAGADRRAAGRARLQGLVGEILAAWDKTDVVCLGEDHCGQPVDGIRCE